MSRPNEARVYRLDITYPEGSREPGFRPYGWEDYLRSLPVLKRRRLRREGFRWPRERMFLSSSGAYERAALLRAFGADVTVLRSDPVRWPAQGTGWESEAYHGAPHQRSRTFDASGLSVLPEEEEEALLKAWTELGLLFAGDGEPGPEYGDPVLLGIARNWGMA